MNLKLVPVLFFILLMPAQAISNQPGLKTIQELSNNIKTKNQSVTLGSEVITLLGEDSHAISKTINIHLRHLLYEDMAENGSKFNYDDILIKKNDNIIYRYNYGNYPSYKIININKNRNVIVITGGYSNDGHIEILEIKNEEIEVTNHFQCESEDIVDFDNDGIEEIVISDDHGFLIPKGSLADSIGISIVLKYNNGFKYSPDLTKEKYSNSLNISNKLCYYDQQNSIDNCKQVIENIVLNFYIGNFANMEKAIATNMIFSNTSERSEFIIEFVQWCFGTQFLSDIQTFSGLNSQNELIKLLTK